jgi:hypothetical protein
VQHKIAVVCVYAACGKDSSAGETQQRAIDAMQRGKCESENAGLHAAKVKSPFTMLLHDLEVVIRELQHDGCTVVVGGDFKVAFSRAGAEPEAPWHCETPKGRGDSDGCD